MTRVRLPACRRGPRWKLTLGGHAVHMTVGEYDDGRPGEVFLDMHKVGTGFRVFSAAFAIVFSLALQHGVPLKVLVHALRDLHGEPDGDATGHETVTTAPSIVALIVRVLEAEYLTTDVEAPAIEAPHTVPVLELFGLNGTGAPGE